MDDSLWLRLGMALWPVRRFLLARRPRRAVLTLALLLSLAPWLPAHRQLAATDFAARSLALPDGSALVGVAVDPVLGRAFVAEAGGAVWALDERSGQVLGASDAASGATGAPSGPMAVDAVRHRVYLAALAGTLALDGRTGLPGRPWTAEPVLGLALDSVADRVLIPQPGQQALVGFDADTRQVVATVALAAPPGPLAVDAPFRRIYVAAADAARLDVLDADTLRSLATVALPGPADALAVDARTHRVYVATAASSTVVTLDGPSGAVLSTLPIGRSVVALALNPATGHLFVADAGANAVVVVDTRRNAILATVPVAAQPVALAVDAQTGLVYVASAPGGAATALPSGSTVTMLRDPGRPATLLAAFLADLVRYQGQLGVGSA